MSVTTRRLVPSSAVALAVALALAAWGKPGASADGPPTKATPAAPTASSLPIYKRGSCKIAFAIPWAMARPKKVDVYFGVVSEATKLGDRIEHKLVNRWLLVYKSTHHDRSVPYPLDSGPGVILIQATDGGGMPMTPQPVPVTVVPVGPGDASPCGD